MPRCASRRAVLAALGAIVLWGSLASIVRELSRWPPFLLAGSALLIGSLVSAPRIKQWRVPARTLALGVYGLAGYHAALFFAFRLAPAVEANLLNYLWPTFIVAFSPLLIPGVHLRSGHVVGTLAGLAGAALIVTRGQLALDHASLPGDSSPYWPHSCGPRTRFLQARPPLSRRRRRPLRAVAGALRSSRMPSSNPLPTRGR